MYLKVDQYNTVSKKKKKRKKGEKKMPNSPEVLCLGPGDEPGGDTQSVVEVAGGVVRAGRHLLLQLVQRVGEGLLQGGRRPQILKVLTKKVHQGYNREGAIK